MYLFAFFFVAGVLVLHAWGGLPAAWCGLSLLCLGWLRRPGGRALAGLACGFCWAAWHAHSAVARIPDPGMEARTLQVEGCVHAQPLAAGEHALRLLFHVERILDGAEWRTREMDARLGWYLAEEPPQPGECWRLAVRLKRPHGFANPGGFDYERWLFQQGIDASGYVRRDTRNRRLSAEPPGPLAAWRLELARLFSRLEQRPSIALVQALTIGVRDGMTADQWDVLNATGTTHLMAISGLHVSLVAGLVFWLVRRLWSWLGNTAAYLPAQRPAALAAIGAALGYAQLAGFGIPARRALIMVTLCMLALLGDRQPRFLPGLLLAAALTLLIDPHSVLAAGWWLSFLAVTVIAVLVSGRRGSPAGRLRRWLSLQGALLVGMVPLLLACFQQVSLLAPLANSIAIPVVGLLVVPLALAGVVLSSCSAGAGTALLNLAATVLDWLWPVLEWLAQLPLARIGMAAPQWPGLLLALCGAALLLAPRGLPVRPLAILLFAPLLLARAPVPGMGDLEITVLDVGQGLAVVLRTAGHVLVYDTGARFSPSFDAGTAVLVPFLLARGIRRVDVLMVSHGDNDHIGGAAALRRRYAPGRILSSVPERFAQGDAVACSAGMHWEWDGVRFEVLHPGADREWSGNDGSCVLSATAANGMRVLLTGDIEQLGEAALQQSVQERLAATLLVAPHHGSATSSSAAFIGAVAPQLVIVPAGYRNRYGFPAAAVLSRYRAGGARVYHTGHDGAVSVSFSARADRPLVQAWRARQRRRFWQWRDTGRADADGAE